MSRSDNSYFYSTWQKMHIRCTDPTYQIAEELGTDQAYVSRLLKRGISRGA